LTIITEYQRYRGLLSVSIRWRCFFNYLRLLCGVIIACG
jgi:hypothetical protein